MGLKEKAARFRNKTQNSLYPWLQELVIGKTITQNLYDTINKNIKDAIQDITEKLDKKLIDMQTLFEIGRELSSTLSVEDLIQIIIFTLIGQYQLSDVAVLSVQENLLKIIGKNRFENLKDFSPDPSFIELLSNSNRTLKLSDFKENKKDFLYLKEQKCQNLIAMKGKDNLIGVILLGERFNQQALSEEDQHFTYTLGTLAGVSLENAGLYEQLDRKYNELSALYEVSKIINSAQETELVLDLIKESLSTGFGVLDGCILLKEGDSWIPARFFKEPEVSAKNYSLSPEEELCISQNQSDIIPCNTSSPLSHTENELFIPLYTVKNTIGALVITEFEHYQLKRENMELVNLFSIIASQISPPILMAQLLQKNSNNTTDLYTPVKQALVSTIESSKAYDLDSTFLRLSLTPYKKYIELNQGQDNPIEDFVQKLGNIKREEDKLIRMSESSFLFVLPAIPPTDVDDLKENTEQLLAKIFDQNNEIALSCEWKMARYPDNSENVSYLLTLLE